MKKKFTALLLAIGAAAVFWRRRSQPTARERAVAKSKAAVATGADRARSAVEQVKDRLERRGGPPAPPRSE